MTLRNRQLNASGDYQFGIGPSVWLVDSPAAVAQAVRTRLALWTGEWFIDTTEGTPYPARVLGAGTMALYDAAIKERILGTVGVAGIAAYTSAYNPTTRAVAITCLVDTIFGQAVSVNGTPQAPITSSPFILDTSTLDSGDTLL